MDFDERKTNIVIIALWSKKISSRPEQHIKMRPEKVFEIIEGSAKAIGEKYEHVLSAHEKQYGQSKIYVNLHEVIKRNHAHLQEFINDVGTRSG